MKTMKPSTCSAANAGKMDKSKLPYLRCLRLGTGEYITRNFPSPQIFQTVFIDFMANLPTTTGGNSCALIIMDQLSRFVIAEPLKTTDPVDITLKIRNELIYRWPQPRYFVSDVGPHFTCSAFVEFCYEFSIVQILTTRRDHITGIVREGDESFKTTKKMLKKLVTTDEKRWDERLGTACFHYNTAVNDSTGYTPFYLVRGYEARKVSRQ